MTSMKDVIAHPAYVKYVLNTTDIERMRAIVSVHDHWQQVTRRRLIVSINDHYKECVWSDPDCRSGPDMCVCSYVSGICFDIIQLLNTLWEEDDENKTTTSNTENKKYGFYGKLQE